MKTLSLIALSVVLAGAQTKDAPGVTVDTGSAVILHRSSVGFPEGARQKAIRGTVVQRLHAIIDID